MTKSMIYIRWKAVCCLLLGLVISLLVLATIRTNETAELHQVLIESQDLKAVTSRIPTSPSTRAKLASNRSSPKTSSKDVVTERSTRNVTKNMPPTKPFSQTIMFMEGWVENEDFYNGEFSVFFYQYAKPQCGYRCTIVRTGEVRFASADVVVFQPSTLRLTPPTKHQHQYWILHSFDKLNPREEKNLQRRGYRDLIDQYIIRPRTVNTPLFFSETFNAVPRDGSMDDDTKIMRYFNRHPSFNIGQIISTCRVLPQSEYAKMLKNNWGGKLKELSSSPSTKLTYYSICYEVEFSLSLPFDLTFVVLDESDCHNSLVEQLMIVLKSNMDAIAVVPVVPPPVYFELLAITPPHSFIGMNEIGNIENLFLHLQKVLTDSELFLSYHRWKASYTLGGKAGGYLV